MYSIDVNIYIYICVCDERYVVSQLTYNINVNICVFAMKDMGYHS